MIMNGDKKNSAFIALIAKKMGKGKPEKIEEAPKNEMGDEVDYSAGEDSAAQEIMDAIDAKDKNKLKIALKSLIELCLDQMDNEPEEEDEEENEQENE